MRSYFSDLNAGARRIADEIEYDPQDPDAAIQSVIDRRGLDGFQWRVWWVAASGFFTTSYSIFAVNVIGPALEYVYQDSDCPPSSPQTSLIINLTTLFGTIVGAVVFGVLADRRGRKAVYGLELAIVIFATIGKYTLSSVIAAEWSSTKSRGRMMAAVFLMQSVGQLAAYGSGLAILVGVSEKLKLSPEETSWNKAAPKIDVIWRAIVGVGAFPALISLFLRRTIPETPYYLVETGRVTDAVTAAGRVYAPEVTLQPTGHDGISPFQTVSNGPSEKVKKSKGWWNNTKEYIHEVRDHLSEKSRWRVLLGVMLTWWLLDLAYYGLGFDNPKTISAIWRSKPPSTAADTLPACGTNQTTEIYQTLRQNIIQNIATISSGTLPGSIVILFAIDYVPRVTWMAWMFVALAALFAVNGGTSFIAFETDKNALTIVLYVLAQFIFNLGPNTMTFILPAELFATKFRGTFYGLAAASGKLGAITILLIINYGVYDGTRALPLSYAFSGTLLGFVPAMLLGAFITWVWIPEVQFPRGHGHDVMRDENASDDGLDHGLQEETFSKKLRLPNRPLAQIAQDPKGGQVLGIRRKLRRLIRHVKSDGMRASTAATLESGADRLSRTGSSSGAHNLMNLQPVNEHEAQLDSGDLGTGIWARER
ncbi:major facilitator superfamily domain-containing protein [Xylaria sp. FL1042]|nr:major facilitator superfamily domain-containing protein [Xylaria sp. FL1042]